jgi:hypothetical protein
LREKRLAKANDVQGTGRVVQWLLQFGSSGHKARANASSPNCFRPSKVIMRRAAAGAVRTCVRTNARAVLIFLTLRLPGSCHARKPASGLVCRRVTAVALMARKHPNRRADSPHATHIPVRLTFYLFSNRVQTGQQLSR